MAYEKVKIKGVREITSKSGQRHHFLEVELMQSQGLYLNDEMLKNLSLYQSNEGSEVLLPCTWGEYNGRPSLSLSDDGIPLPAPQKTVVDTSTGEIKPANPGLFGNKPKAA